MNDYFCGWYFKCQSDSETLAVIAASHKSKIKRYCSLQVITDEASFIAKFPYKYIQHQKSNLHINISKNYLGENGMTFDTVSPDLEISGNIIFGDLTPIKYDIMGPFCYVPFMECRHSVVSMKHTVNGNIYLNGHRYDFINAKGYIEGDRGRSFPKEYAWTQCCFESGSLMLSVASIPLGNYEFTGIIAVIHLNGKEYRLATYLGAKASKIKNGEIIITQRNMTFSAKLLDKNSHPLSAPSCGLMNRTIHESASCRAYYYFQKIEHTLLNFETSKASFEYEYSI